MFPITYILFSNIHFYVLLKFDFESTKKPLSCWNTFKIAIFIFLRRCHYSSIVKIAFYLIMTRMVYSMFKKKLSGKL
jgi:hypothetical protein